MKILFITEKYVFVDKPSNGMTNSIHNIIGSWECAHIGEYKHLFISKDPQDLWSVKDIDNALLNEKYDIAFISPHSNLNCSEAMSSLLGNRLIICWWDNLLTPINKPGISPGERWWEYANRGNINIVLDHGIGQMYKNTWAFETPQDTRIFNANFNIEEDIDVSLLGAINTRPDRMEIVKKLQNEGINVWKGGGRATDDSDNHNMPINEYVKIHQRSKICINPQAVRNHPSRKGRGFEIAACGKFMLANHPSALDGWFTRGIHYSDFNNDNIVEKVKYFLRNPDVRKKIGKSIYDEYQSKYLPNLFWNKVLEIAKKTSSCHHPSHQVISTARHKVSRPNRIEIMKRTLLKNRINK